MINIRPVGKSAWEDLLETLKPHTFLQSWNWGEFNKSLGHKIFRTGIYENEKLVGIALIIKIKARRGSFLFIPHGPILTDEKNIHELIHLYQFAKKLAKKEKCSFIRVSPISVNTKELNDIYGDLGFREAPIHMHSELNWILDITKSEEELLSGMRKTTRYSISKAEKEGVQIETSKKTEDVKIFNEIYSSTVKRQHFTPFSLKYLEREFESFAKDDKAMLFFAKYNGTVIGSAIIIFSESGAFYHQGATDLKYPKVPAAYLLQWEVIKEAKKRGLSFYNFWGIAPEGKKKHPWAGLSLFKKGFGGYSEEYIHAKDLKLDSKYWLSHFVEKIRKIKRGL